MKYWKLQCNGPNPYFCYKQKDIYIFPTIAGILTTALSVAVPPFCDLMVIDKEGKPQNLLRFNLEKLFRDNPVLLKEFKAEPIHSPEVIVKYLTRYNDSKRRR